MGWTEWISNHQLTGHVLLCNVQGSVCQQGCGRSLLGRIWADRIVSSCTGHVLRGGEEGAYGCLQGVC